MDTKRGKRDCVSAKSLEREENKDETQTKVHRQNGSVSFIFSDLGRQILGKGNRLSIMKRRKDALNFLRNKRTNSAAIDSYVSSNSNSSCSSSSRSNSGIVSSISKVVL